MKRTKWILFLWCSLFFRSPLVQALASESSTLSSGEVEEVTYDELLHRLSFNKNKPSTTSVLETQKFHFGLGFVSSFSQTQFLGQTRNNVHTGLQITAGMDFPSPQWFFEIHGRNFSFQRKGSEETSMRELDFCLGRQDEVSSRWRTKFAVGLATRFLQFAEETQNVGFNTTTPSLFGSLGVFSQVSSVISLGVESSYRSPLVSTPDRGGWDLGFQALSTF